jgi:integrase
MTLIGREERGNDMKRQPKDSFPLIITKGSASVKIYRGQNRGKPFYTLTYIGASGRVRETFMDLEEARREANTRAGNLAQGDLEALKLTGRERQIFVAAAEALKPTGISLDIAAREFATAFEILGHDAIIEAARYYKRHVESALPEITVSEAVARFTEAKTAEGMSSLYLKDIRLILGRLAHACQCNIKALTADDLRDYLAHMNVGPVAKNNHRRLIVALFNFAKLQGWLNKSESTAADALGAVKVKDKPVEIYTPKEMAALLTHADTDFLPWLLLIGFGGIRREELAKGLRWEDVDFKRKTIIVPAAIAKTGRKRKIAMPNNLVAWLKPYAGHTGTIFEIDPRKRMAKVTEASGVAWKRNALRHSFGSYRTEATKNAGQVALEMGNSPAVVMAHYHEIVHAADAKAWWALKPADSGKVVPMPKAA